jgi:hypothetical protein
MKTALFILVCLLLVGCEDNLIQNQSNETIIYQTDENYLRTRIRVNNQSDWWADSVLGDIPNGLVAVAYGGDIITLPFSGNDIITVYEPVSSGYKMIRDTDTTAIDSMRFDIKDSKLIKWTSQGGTSFSFSSFANSFVLYTVTQ